MANRMLWMMGLASCLANRPPETNPVVSTNASSGDTGSTVTGGCTNAIVFDRSSPVPDADDVYYRSGMLVVLDAADDTAAIELETEDGTPVPGISQVSGTSVMFEPDNPLQPNTRYLQTVERDCGTTSFAWTTGALGTPLKVDVVGLTYSLHLVPPTQWLGDPALETLAMNTGEAAPLLLSPTQVGGTVSWLLAPRDGEGQALCRETSDLVGAIFTDPHYDLFGSLPSNILGFEVLFSDFEFTGDFQANGSSIEHGTLVSVVDTRDMALALPTLGWDTVCDTTVCLPCPSGGNTCVELNYGSIHMPQLNVPVVRRLNTDIKNDPECPE